MGSSQICIKQPCFPTKCPFIRMCNRHQDKRADIQWCVPGTTIRIHWNIEKGSFTFINAFKDQPAIHRGILSTLASIYDPLGFLAPFVLTGKRISQEMYHQGTNWDDPLPEMLKPKCSSWQHNFTNLKKINMAWWYLRANFGEIVET